MSSKPTTLTSAGIRRPAFVQRAQRAERHLIVGHEDRGHGGIGGRRTAWSWPARRSSRRRAAGGSPRARRRPVHGRRARHERTAGARHRTVGTSAGRTDWLEAKARVAGWRARGWPDARAEIHPPLVGDWRPRAGHDHAVRLAGRSRRDRDLRGNDQMALGTLRALHERPADRPT